jgi:hypothetical protein
LLEIEIFTGREISYLYGMQMGRGGGLAMLKRFRTVNSVQSAHCGVRIRKLNEVQENSKLLIDYIYF